MFRHRKELEYSYLKKRRNNADVIGLLETFMQSQTNMSHH